MCRCEKDQLIAYLPHKTELPHVNPMTNKQHRHLPHNYKEKCQYVNLKRGMCTVLMCRQGELREAGVCRKPHALLAVLGLPDHTDFNKRLCRHVPKMHREM